MNKPWHARDIKLFHATNSLEEARRLAGAVALLVVDHLPPENGDVIAAVADTASRKIDEALALLNQYRDAGPRAAADVDQTMDEYNAFKARYPGFLLFYRMDDFYELYFDDAIICARVTGLLLARQGEHEGVDISMCGVPVERCEDYLDQLIVLGHRVAVCETIADSPSARKRCPELIGRREVARTVMTSPKEDAAGA